MLPQKVTLHFLFILSSLPFLISTAVLRPNGLARRMPVTMGGSGSAFRPPQPWTRPMFLGETRAVYLIISEFMNDPVLTMKGGIVRGVHVAIHFGATSSQKALRYELVRQGGNEKPIFQLSVFSGDLPDPIPGSATSGRASTNRVFSLGEVKQTNRGLFIALTHITTLARRVYLDLGKEAPVTAMKATMLNIVSHKLLAGKLPPLPVFNLIAASFEWEAAKRAQPGSLVPRDPFPSNYRNALRLASYGPMRFDNAGRFTGGRMKFLGIQYGSDDMPPRQSTPMRVFGFDARSALMPLGPWKVAEKIDDSGMKTIRTSYYPAFSTPEYRSLFPVQDTCRIKRTGFGRALMRRDICPALVERKVPTISNVGDKLPVERTTVRVKGVATTIQAFDKVVGAAGAAGIVAGPAFIIYDISKGNAVGAAVNSIGFAIDIALLVASRSIMFAGPIGLITAPLLFFLPSLFEKKHPAGRSNNLTEIVQFKFFGERSTKGNENCVKDRLSQGLDDDCTMLYGPGKIAQTFGWEYYDGVAFVVNFNDGYHMAIEDIAAAFHVVPTAPDDDDTTDKIATVSCDRVVDQVFNSDTPYAAYTYLSRESGYECKNAKFKIKRELITLPNINKTAAEIYSRIVTPKGGDCKPVVDPLDGSLLPDYNYTWIGMPAAIACNLTIPTLAQIGVANGSTSALKPTINTFNTSLFSNNTDTCSDDIYPTDFGNSTSNSTDPDFDDIWTILDANSTSDPLSETNSTQIYSYNNTGDAPEPDAPVEDGGTGLPSNDSKVPLDQFNSTDLSCLFAFSTDFLNSDSYDALPAAFYAGNSSITNNATAYISPANASTDGTAGRGYIPVPPVTPFKVLDTTNSVCFTYPSHNYCLPNGTFTGVFAKTASFDLGLFTSMTGPPGSSVSFKWRPNYDPSGTGNFEPDFTVDTFKPNMTIKSEFESLALARNGVSIDKEKSSLEIIIPIQYQTPSACLYTNTDFKGEVRCLGVGAGNLTADFQNKASSITTHGNATTYVFANRYGDASETKVGGPIRDLRGLLYSVNNSLNDLLVALWVIDPRAP